MEQPPSVVARWLAAGDSGDVGSFDDLLHGHVVVHAPRGLSSQDLQSEKQVWRHAVAAMPDIRHEVQEVVVDGDVGGHTRGHQPRPSTFGQRWRSSQSYRSTLTQAHSDWVRPSSRGRLGPGNRKPLSMPRFGRRQRGHSCGLLLPAEPVAPGLPRLRCQPRVAWSVAPAVETGERVLVPPWCDLQDPRRLVAT